MKYTLHRQLLFIHFFTLIGFAQNIHAQDTVNYRLKGLAVDSVAGKPPALTTVVNLKEAEIIAKGVLVKQKLGGISYDMQADPESKASNLLEIMWKIPYLSADAEGNILLKGNNSFRILINGKPSSMMERNPTEVLRSIPASTIVRVEVITSPPPKYEAEGLGGLINIITSKRASNGYNGTVNIYERFPVGGPGVGTSFAFKEGKFGFSGYAGGNFYNTPSYSNTLNRETLLSNPNTLVQSGTRNIDNKSGYVGAELSWDLDSINLISGQLNFNGSDSETFFTQSSALNAETGFLESYNVQNAINYSGNGMDAALNFQHGFRKNKANLLTFSYRFYQFNNYNRHNLVFAKRLNFDQPDFRQSNQEGFRENTAQIDYVHPSKTIKVEMGAKAIWRDNVSDFQYAAFNPSSNTFEKLPSFSNAYDYLQDVYAFYNSYTLMGAKWAFLGGFRIEQTNTSANFSSTSTKVNQDFFNVIPSIMLNYTLSEGNSLNVGFVQRIRRPNIVRINPYVDRSNPNVQATGNPNLVPVLLNDIQLGYSYSKKVSINVGLGYSFFNKLDLRIYSFNPTTNVTSITFANVGEGSRVGLDLNINYPISDNISFNLNGNIAQFSLQGETDRTLFDNKWLTFFAAPSLTFNLNKGWRANIDLNINSQNPSSLQGTTNGFVSSSFGLNKELAKRKLVLSGTVSNPFNKFRNNITAIVGAGFEERSLVREYFRSFNFSLNYRFGQSKAEVSRSKRNIKNDDLAK